MIGVRSGELVATEVGSRFSTSALRRLGVNAARLELLAHGAGQALRLGSSLVLSRLLFPEAFGLSVIVGAVGAGLAMISNVGVGQSIVQHARGDEPAFLNTGWTVLALRGLALWLAACLLAYPLAHLLRQPELLVLLPVGSLTILIGGLSSTSLMTLRRRLQVAPLIRLELLGQVLTLVVNVSLAWLFKSVWALIVGGLVGAAFSAVCSHFLKVGYRNRFHWDPTAWREIYAYGKWVQASSALSFASNQADRFLMVRFADMAALGVYNYASILADAISAAVVRVTHGVLFPAFSQINRDNPLQLADTYYRVRLRMDLLTLTPIGAVAALSQAIVDLLFDARYAQAGWMLQALCLRAGMVCLLTPVETYLFAVGRTQYGFYRDLARTLWVLPGMPLAWAWGGLGGLVWVVALSELPVLVVLWTAFQRHGRLRLRRELIGPMAFGVGMAAGGGLLWVLKTLAWR